MVLELLPLLEKLDIGVGLGPSRALSKDVEHTPAENVEDLD